MESYVEKRLVGLHSVGTAAKFKEKFVLFIAGLFVIFLIPALHFGESI